MRGYNLFIPSVFGPSKAKPFKEWALLTACFYLKKQVKRKNQRPGWNDLTLHTSFYSFHNTQGSSQKTYGPLPNATGPLPGSNAK
jgi:hypothetical protein